ncbi:hypothetical protein EDC19_2770 [Natranaerovirga hydrolytica]|uniref:ABC transporter permease n=1 Tax=Natranaerovirga hydrolytica TaxID=680378 RepID=A0A4R1M6N9_9FIRM|nr:hypothetical protein [Natranaerovirga hydrolytica]TCK87926.1 hypothetical protein EDC19_2770 [Natranaerovirga hydrolytica]
MDQNIQKALWLGVGILFFVAVISIGIMVFSQGMQLVEESEDSIRRTNQRLSSVQYERYVLREQSGSNVVAAIDEFKEYAGVFKIEVRTGTKEENEYISTGDTKSLDPKDREEINKDLRNVRDPSSDQYINPNGRFEGEILYDDNGVERILRFEQQ